MYYLYTDQILLGNSSDGSQKCPLKLFFTIISETIQFNLIVFYTIAVFDLIRQFLIKIFLH